MKKAQEINKIKNLKDEEISRREELAKEFWEIKGAEKDIRNIFELIYLSFIPFLGNRDLVEDDLKELKSMIYACADRMIAIREKSKGKRPGVRKASAYPGKNVK